MRKWVNAILFFAWFLGRIGGVKGIRLRKGDYAVGMLVASPDMTLLTACANGYGKRTAIGPNAEPEEEKPEIDGDIEAPEVEPERTAG